MQAKAIKTGVLYAYAPSKYSHPRPVVVLDVEETYRLRGGIPSKHSFEQERERKSVHYDNYVEIMARPIWQVGRRDPRTGKPMVNFPSHAYGYHESETGYLVVSVPAAHAGKAMDTSPEMLRRLRAVTLDEVLAITANDNRSGNLPGLEVFVVRPRDLVGDWEEISEARATEAELRQNLADQARAESDARVANAQQRVDALRALNLPGRFADAKESHSSGWGHETPTYEGNTGAVSLTLDQVDALLSLIPEGVVYTPPSDTEDDDWTYRKPEYDTDND